MISTSSIVDRVRFRGEAWTPELRQFALLAVQNALGRFERRIADVTVTLRDLNGPRGGVDKRCNVLLKQHRRRAVIIQATSDNPYAAIAKACTRTRRKVVAALARPAALARHFH